MSDLRIGLGVDAHQRTGTSDADVVRASRRDEQRREQASSHGVPPASRMRRLIEKSSWRLQLRETIRCSRTPVASRRRQA